jgi:hypothetical protein
VNDVDILYIMNLQELLYQCIRELDYVQCVENCDSGLCATSLGKNLVEKGMKLLVVSDLSREKMYAAVR